MPLSPGQTLKERYRIVGLLGQGGFGAVYRGWDLTFEIPCAIKENTETSEAARRQFLREAKLLHVLRHTNLPLVKDYFFIPGQGQYLVMDFVEGQDLGEMLQDGPLPEAKVLPWIIQVCDALSYLHSQNPAVIHRDIKPGNIKITPDGRAMLVDFGISKVYDPNMATTVGARAVTPGYSPPEQYGKGTTDVRSDLYALGATLYHLLTGQTPPDSVDILTHNTQPPRPAVELDPDISPEIAAAISKAMELERERRWGSAEEFKRAITTKPTPPRVEPRPPVTKVAPTQAVRQPAEARPARGVRPPAAPREGVPWRWIGGMAALIVVVLIGYAIGSGGDGSDLDATRTAIALATRITDTSIPPLSTTQAPARAATQAPTSTPTEAPVSPQALASPEATITDAYGVSMALVPAGPFEMGSEEGDSDERPVHSVSLEAFYIDVYEVTNSLYASFLNEMGNQEQGGVTWLDAGDADARTHQSGGDWGADSGYADHPAVEVSWYGARALCQWRGGDLPSEAQWEKAARGGLEVKAYPWGDEAPVCQNGGENGAQFGDCDGQTVPVGSFSPNGYGLFDMAGNVWEWVLDWYAKDYYASSPSANPSGPSSGDGRVLRGGSWGSYPNSLRVANRVWYGPDSPDHDGGFRCARSP